MLKGCVRGIDTNDQIWANIDSLHLHKRYLIGVVQHIKTKSSQGDPFKNLGSIKNEELS